MVTHAWDAIGNNYASRFGKVLPARLRHFCNIVTKLFVSQFFKAVILVEIDIIRKLDIWKRKLEIWKKNKTIDEIFFPIVSLMTHSNY